MMDDIKIEISDEQREQLRKALADFIESANEVWQVIQEVVTRVMETVREIAVQLGRFFLKMQLLEWRVPLSAAEFISQKMYWLWAFRLGFNWFERKMAMIE